MEASILDLRYKMKDVLKALDRNECVKVFFHGKLKGTIRPQRMKTDRNIDQHPFFGMSSDRKESVDEVMRQLRGGRYDTL